MLFEWKGQIANLAAKNKDVDDLNTKIQSQINPHLKFVRVPGIKPAKDNLKKAILIKNGPFSFAYIIPIVHCIIESSIHNWHVIFNNKVFELTF
jgi:hypothetical protein